MFRASANVSREAIEAKTLANVPPGGQVEVIGFTDDFPADRKAYLQAYGLVLKHQVQVVQHSPVTIIRLDNIELALESDLAQGIMVRIPTIERPNAS